MSNFKFRVLGMLVLTLIALTPFYYCFAIMWYDLPNHHAVGVVFSMGWALFVAYIFATIWDWLEKKLYG